MEMLQESECKHINCDLIEIPEAILEEAKRWDIPVDSLSHPRCKTTYVGKKMLQFVSHKDDDSIPRFISEILADDGYNAARMKMLYSPFIIDIGANLGAFAILAYTINPSSTIVSFEPNPLTYIFFKWNLILNCIPILEEISAGDKINRNRGVMPFLSAATKDGREVTVEYNVFKSENTITSASSQNGILPKYSLNSPGEFARKQMQSISIENFLKSNSINHITFF
jgi:hypothetical protein